MLPLLPELPHPEMLMIDITVIRPSRVRQKRRRAGMPMKNSRASTAPPPPNKYFSDGWDSVALVCAVVATVRVADAAVVPATLTVEGMLQVTGSTAFVGLAVTAQASFTVPINPAEGVTLTVAVFPVAAPRLNWMFPLLLSENPGASALTITSTDV